MTIEIVKKQMERLLKYAHTPAFTVESCYNMAYGSIMMASNIALELGDCQLSIAIDRLWNDTYRELFLQAYREELTQQ